MKTRGFTLIEVMVVVAIVGLLAMVAIPSYLDHLKKGRRTDAKTALFEFATRQERHASIKNVYADTPDQLGYGAASTTFPINVLSGGTSYYKLSVTLATDKLAFTAKATPQGSQLADTCGIFTLDNLGTQSNEVPVATTDTSMCW